MQVVAKCKNSCKDGSQGPIETVGQIRTILLQQVAGLLSEAEHKICKVSKPKSFKNISVMHGTRLNNTSETQARHTMIIYTVGLLARGAP